MSHMVPVVQRNKKVREPPLLTIIAVVWHAKKVGYYSKSSISYEKQIAPVQKDHFCQIAV